MRLLQFKLLKVAFKAAEAGRCRLATKKNHAFTDTGLLAQVVGLASDDSRRLTFLEVPYDFSTARTRNRASRVKQDILWLHSHSQLAVRSPYAAGAVKMM